MAVALKVAISPSLTLVSLGKEGYLGKDEGIFILLNLWQILPQVSIPWLINLLILLSDPTDLKALTLPLDSH